MWDDQNSYLNATEQGPNEPSAPELIANNTATYCALVRGIGPRNIYRLIASFGATPCENCLVVNEPQIGALDNGTGLSNGASMNNGEIQVEGYCPNGQAEQDGANWYCVSGNRRRMLQKSDYELICRRTYSGHPNAFAFQDGDSSLMSYRWRCYDRQ